jgi:hypothetical protein
MRQGEVSGSVWESERIGKDRITFGPLWRECLFFLPIGCNVRIWFAVELLFRQIIFEVEGAVENPQNIDDVVILY